MATAAPFGLRQNRNLIGSAENFQGNYYRIKKGYASAIGFGDAVITLTSTNQGYIGPYANGGSHILGVLVGLLPYYDTVLQQVVNKNWYAGTESPSDDIIAQVIDDPNQTFLIQSNGGPYTEAARGQNADIVNNGSPNTFGASIAALDYANIGTSALPLRIVGPGTLSYGGADPTIKSSLQGTYGLIEVALNTTEYRNTTGI